ncbi:MAG: pilus assembly protein PilP [Deltaproteobacteria bacterium]|nr:pilus assembly protein PilP [Deltaproteobacteria bacterium]
MKTQRNIRHLPFTLSFLLIATAPLSIQAIPEPDGGGATGTNPVSEQSTLELPATTGDPSAVFSYQLEGRPDPFSPFITEKAANYMEEVVDGEEALTGMQLFEPGQLKLVAIVLENNAEIAMVEDASGQGYVIRPGMKIGRKGKVTSIDPNQVNIEETSVTRAGKKSTNNIVMLLKKKGEE